jgi:hypothetical protein
MDLKRIKNDLADRCISEDDTRELIAEVEFLTKVAEQAVEIGALGQYDCSGQPYITSRYIGSGRGQQCHEASEDYPELAQYLKMGKE